MSSLRKYPMRFLKSFCPTQLYEEIEGDLIQKYEKNAKAFGEKRANRRLMQSAIQLAPKGLNTLRQGEALS